MMAPQPHNGITRAEWGAAWRAVRIADGEAEAPTPSTAAEDLAWQVLGARDLGYDILVFKSELLKGLYASKLRDREIQETSARMQALLQKYTPPEAH